MDNNNNIISSSNSKLVEFPMLTLSAPTKFSALTKLACIVFWGASNVALGISIANKGRFSPLTASLAGLSALTLVIFVKLITLPQQIVRRDELNAMFLQLSNQLNEKHQEILVNTVQTLNEQIDNIKSEAKKNKASTDKDLETLKGDIKSNKDSSDGRFNLINSNFETLKGDIKSNTESSDRRFNLINSNLETLKGDIKSNKDSSDGRLNLINSNLEALKGEITSVEQKIQGMNDAINQNKSESDKNIAQQKNTNLSQIDKFSKKLEKIKNQLNLQASVQSARNESKISDKNETIIIQDNQELGKQAKKLNKLNGKVKNLTNQVQELNSKIDLQNEQANQLWNENKQAIEKNKKQINKSINQIKSDAGKSIKTLQQQIDLLKALKPTSFNNNIIHEESSDATSTENALVVPRSDIREPLFDASMAPFHDSESISTDELTDLHVRNMMSDIKTYCAKMISFHTANYQKEVCTTLKNYRTVLHRLSYDHRSKADPKRGYSHIDPKHEAGAADTIDAMIEKIDALIIDNTPTSCNQPTLQLSGLAEVVEATTKKLQTLITKFKRIDYTPKEGECLRTMAMAMKQYLLVKRLKAYIPDEDQHKNFIKSLNTLEACSLALSSSGSVWRIRANLMSLEEQGAYMEMKDSATQKIKNLEADVKKLGPAENSMINLAVELECFSNVDRTLYGIKWYNDSLFAYQAPDKQGTFTYERLDWEVGTVRVLNDLYNAFQKRTEPWQNLFRRCQVSQIPIAQMLANSFANKSAPLPIENSN